MKKLITALFITGFLSINSSAHHTVNHRQMITNYEEENNVECYYGDASDVFDRELEFHTQDFDCYSNNGTHYSTIKVHREIENTRNTAVISNKVISIDEHRISSGGIVPAANNLYRRK